MAAPSKQQWELGLVVGLSLVVAAAAVLAGRFDAVTGARPVVVIDQPLDRTTARTAPDLQLTGPWLAAENGLILSAGQSGAVVMPVTMGRKGRVSLFLHGRGDPGFRHSLEISEDGRRYRPVQLDVSLDGMRVDFTRAAGHLGSFWLKISVMSGAVAPDATFRLSRLKIVEVRPPIAIPNPFVALIVFTTPIVAWLTRRSLVGSGAVGFAVMVLGGVAILAEVSAWIRAANPLRWWELVVAGLGRDAYFFAPYAALLARWAWRQGPADAPGFSVRTWSAWTLFGILLWGGSLRLGALLEVGWGPLNPDAITYMKLAELMTSPYDTGLREPFWIWMIAGWFKLMGASPLSLRLLTFLLSMLVIWVGFAFARGYTGTPIVGLLVAAALAMNPFMVTLSARGLREEAYLLAILALASLLLVPHPRLTTRSGALGLAVAGGAAQLLRFNSYTFLAPLLLWWVWQKPKERLVAVMIPVLFITAVSIPHLRHNAAQFGDPLFSVNAHFMWSRNYEFVVLKETGCDGCPSREEFEANPVSGARIGAFEYVFGMHTLGEVLRYTADGYARMYLAPTELFEIQSGTRSLWLFFAYLTGLGVVLLSAWRALLLWILLLANGVPFAMSLGIDARLGIQTAPFITVILAIGLHWLGEQAWRRRLAVARWLDGGAAGARRV